MKKLGDITDAKYIHILVGEELKQRLVKKAEEKKLSLSSYIRMLLNEILEDEEK